MKKLRLEVETLSVESFPTAPDAEAIGTVYAAQVEAFATRTSCGGGYPPCTCPPPTD